jgi:thioredoxin 1
MNDKVIEVTDASFEKVISKGVTLVDFWAPWCGPCRMQLPINEKLALAFADRATIAKMDVDKNPEIATKLGVTSIPTLIIFVDGKKEEQFVGVQTNDILSRTLEKYLAESKK